jgi:MoaA/NifB/PqqE/SkfB family radical SAM enzyme
MHVPAPGGPRRVTFVTSPDDCNLSCPMCRDHSPWRPGAASHPGAARRRMAPQLPAEVLGQPGAGAVREVIPSTRGEPLLWDGLEGLLRACQARGVPVNVTTNGTFPGRGAAAWAELLAPACSDVKLSWNAATPATATALMPGLSLPRALEDVRALLAVRDRLRAAGRQACTVSFQVTAQERNVAELPAIVALAAALGVERVKVNQLQVHFPALAGEDLRRDAGARGRWEEAVRGMRAAAAAARARGRPVRLQNVAHWPAAGPVAPCPFLGQEAWIAFDGEFLPCPAPAGQDGLLGRFGSVRQRTLAGIWESAEYRALVAGHETRPPCAGCALRRPGGA